LKPSGLAGELVVAIEETDVTATILDRQFARTPYAVSFQAGAEELTLVTLHVIWGDDEEQRADELREIATWLADWPNRESTWSKNLITLGDFNVNRGALYDALISTGLTTPVELNVFRARSSRVEQAVLLRPDRVVPRKRQPLGPLAQVSQRRQL
jgi:endonuclease/exonuclease/phosphatase family metal-dependent hydrolase